MAIILPDIKGRRCLEIACCGFIASDKVPETVQEVKKAGKSLIARYTKSGEEIFMRLVLPFPWEKGTGGRIHVHLVVARKERFTKNPPETNSTPEEILALFDPFLGKEIQACLTGLFRVPLAEMPSFIRSTLVGIRVKDVEVSMTGGTLSVRGAPIREISWSLPEGDGPVTISLEARTRVTLDGSYLEVGLELLESAFDALIAGEKDDSQSS